MDPYDLSQAHLLWMTHLVAKPEKPDAPKHSSTSLEFKSASWGTAMPKDVVDEDWGNYRSGNGNAEGCS